MTTKNDVTIETVEQLYNVAVRQGTYDASKRWTLHDWTNNLWVDDAAGRVWQDEWNNLTYPENYWGMSDADRAAYDAKRQDIVNRKPAQRKVTNYQLEHSDGNKWSRSEFIYLGSELGAQIDAIWKKGPAWKNAPAQYTKRVGVMTLNGILKRLGKNGLDKEIAAAVDLKKRQDAAQNENWKRRNVKKAAEELSKALEVLAQDNPDLANAIKYGTQFTQAMEWMTAMKELEVPNK